MQIQIKTIKIAYKRKYTDYKNIILTAVILLPLLLINFYPSHTVFGQNEKQPLTTKDILICQVTEYIQSPVGSNTQQATNICNHQNSIGYNQSLSELCFIFSGEDIDIINAYCNKAMPTKGSTTIMSETPISTDQASISEPKELAPVIENDQKSGNQDNTDNGLKVTIFDGVSKFFSGVFNP